MSKTRREALQGRLVDAAVAVCVLRTATTLLGPPLPPPSLCTRLYTVKPVAGSSAVRARFSSPHTFWPPSRRWVRNWRDWPRSVLAVSIPNPTSKHRWSGARAREHESNVCMMPNGALSWVTEVTYPTVEQELGGLAAHAREVKVLRVVAGERLPSRPAQVALPVMVSLAPPRVHDH